MKRQSSKSQRILTGVLASVFLTSSFLSKPAIVHAEEIDQTEETESQDTSTKFETLSQSIMEINTRLESIQTTLESLMNEQNIIGTNLDSAKASVEDGIESSQDLVDYAQVMLDEANENYDSLDSKSSEVEEIVANAQASLDDANSVLSDAVTLQTYAYAQEESDESTKARETSDSIVEEAEQSVKDAETLLEEAQTNKDSYEALLLKAQSNVEDAKAALDEAKKALEEAETKLSEAKVYNKVVYGVESEYTIPDGYLTSYTLRPEEAGDKKITYTVYAYRSNGEKYLTNNDYAKMIKSTGTITPYISYQYSYTYTKSDGTTGQLITSETLDKIDSTKYPNATLVRTKESITEWNLYIIAKWDGGQAEYNIAIKDGESICRQSVVSATVDSIIKSTIKDSMSDEQKIEAVTRYIAYNYSYSEDYSSAYGMFTSGGGDCWSSTEAIIEICEKLGFKCWWHNANYISGYGNGHANALVKATDGTLYICEAGYNDSAPRGYSFTSLSDFTISTNSSTGTKILYRANNPEAEIVEVPSGVTKIAQLANGSIKSGAFTGAYNAKKVVIPSSVTEIMEENYRTSKYEFEVASDNTKFKSINGGLLTKDGKTLLSANHQAQSYTVPSTVKTIGAYSFSGCTVQTIQQAILNEGLETISTNAFYYTNIAKLIFPKSLKTIEEDAFSGRMTSAKTFIFQNANTSIPDGMILKKDTVYGYKNSTAESAANLVGATFIVLDSTTDLSQPEIQEEKSTTKLSIENVSDEDRITNIANAQKNYDDASSKYNSALEDYRVFSYTLTLNANGGSVTPTSRIVAPGYEYGELPTPIREGYTFDGWYTLLSGGMQVFSSTKMGSSDTTIYAHWTAKTYLLIFDANEGYVSTDTKKIDCGSEYGTLPTPKRTGYNFDGWFTAPDGGTQVTSSTKMRAAYTKVYAHWTIKSYTLTFDPNGGTVSETSRSVQYNSAYGELPTPTREGYTFDGWYTSKTGGTQATSSTIMDLYNRTIYAHWTNNSSPAPSVTPEPSPSETTKKISMYRLYNPNSGEHFYTSNTTEKNKLVSLGWIYEGIGWTAPSSGAPVYRMYNANGGEHHYTLSASERDSLVKVGWKYEGIGWYSANSSDSNAIPLHREYNPNTFANNHNYTTSDAEHNWLISLGWKDEGVAWYGVEGIAY